MFINVKLLSVLDFLRFVRRKGFDFKIRSKFLDGYKFLVCLFVLFLGC